MYIIKLNCDTAAKVWTATSKKFIGLVLESDTVETLINKYKNAFFELLDLNNQLIQSTKTLRFQLTMFCF